ncbi:MAG: ABC transporter ATP-binding protein [Eubacterium sp.]|nr:ABC transporter ATP-binding protein [Eubacterium sp.]
MIRVKDIIKRFGASQVLKGVSFEVESGTIYGLIGKNGAGKTTLMKIMSGLLTADGGSSEYVNFAGETDDSEQVNSIKNYSISKISSLSVKGIAYLPDLPEFYDYLTTDEYLDFLLMNQNSQKNKRRDELLQMVGLPSGVRVKTMSRGMRQRLGIAGVLVNDPDIILLDEPTSALDPSGRNDVKNILMKLKNEGKTIILSTHILADMDSICDKAGFLSGGIIAKEVDVAESRENSSELIIKFATEPDLDTLYKFAPSIFVIDPLTIRIVLDKNNKLKSQQDALNGLSRLPQEITSITSAEISLDNIFREVCI